MKFLQNIGIFTFVLYLCIICVGVVGWCMNLSKLADCDFEAPYKAEVIRTVSFFVFPISGIVGYIDLGK